MSLLEKIQNSVQEISRPEIPEATPDSQAPLDKNRPREICRVCGRVLGRNFWLDAYGVWHCAGCDPPAVPGQIRDEMFVDLDDDGRPAPDLWGSLPGLSVLAVFWPDGSINHSPRATSTQRRLWEALAQTAWCRNEEQKPRKVKPC